MPDLVALDLPPGPAFVDALRRVWDDGNTALPVDQRLPAAARDELLEAMGPHRIIGADGEQTPGRWPSTPMQEGDALLVATSGTTGEPKGVVLARAGVEAHARAVHARLDVDPRSDRWLACLPLAHVAGLGVVTRAILTDTPLEVLTAFDVAEVTAAARSRGATLTSLVPTALDRLAGAAEAFRWVVLGASADTRSRPPNVTRTYGLTETGGGVVYDGIPLGGTEVRVVDGEIEVRGATLLRRYRDGTDPKDADGWLATGDLGALDAEDRLIVHGRRGDLIITGGENVWPDAVQATLAAHPSVAEVAVAGRPDPDWGQRVVAFVVPRDPAAPPSLDELRDHAKATLAAFAAPRELVLVARLPRSALGKIRRTDLLP
ncbi:o-succinylbenzoate--CoA ligase [soil metagenome]